MSAKNLLVISHSYSAFVKDQVDIISKYFSQTHVMVRHNPIAELSRLFPVDYLTPYAMKNIIDAAGKPENLKVIPTPIAYLPTNRGYEFLGEKHFFSLEKAIKKHKIKFDLIHSHFTWSAGYAGARLKQKYNVPFVVTAHGYDIYELPFRDPVWNERIKYVLDTADYVITVSEKNLHCIREIGVRTNVEVIPNGFNNDVFYPQDKNTCGKILGLPTDRKIILTIGNLVQVKGHTYLISAMAELIKERSDLLCVIVGGGQLKKDLYKQIAAANLKNHIVLAGIKPHSQIPFWINACDVFVLPSLNEGNPTVMFECLGCGKPFVGSMVGGVPEIIVSDHYGFLCEPKNVAQLKEKIMGALEKEWNEVVIADYARQFNWSDITGRIYKIYNTLLGGW